MNDYSLRRNGEWYSDPTAYNAITGKPKEGECWTVERNGITKTVLVIKVNGDVCNILSLYDEEKSDCVPVRAKAMMYTNPAMLSYCFANACVDFVRKLSQDEFREVIRAVEKVLTITIWEETPPPAENGNSETAGTGPHPCTRSCGCDRPVCGSESQYI